MLERPISEASLIGKPRLERKEGRAICVFDVDFGPERPATLWYSFDEAFADFCTATCDGAAVALLVPAMLRRLPLRIAGPINAGLFDALTGPLQKIVSMQLPDLQPTTINVEQVTREGEGGSGVVTGLSGGIDSFTVLADHFYQPRVKATTITHFLYNNVGSHGFGGRELFRARRKALAPLFDRLGLPVITVDSNLGEFYAGFKFQQTHTLRNVSVPLILGKGFRTFLYASGLPYAQISISPTYDMACADPIILGALSTPALAMHSAGAEYTKIEKTAKVAEIEDSYEFLDVCVNTKSGENCGVCWKCKRTLLTLHMLGKLEKYSAVFPLDRYLAAERAFIGEVCRSDDVLLREIAAFETVSSFKFPAYLKYRGVLKRRLKGLI